MTLMSHATITNSTLTAGTGIVVGRDSRDDCIVTARGNNLAGNIVGARNLQVPNPLIDLRQNPADLRQNWWGKSEGPDTPGAASAIGPSILNLRPGPSHDCNDKRRAFDSFATCPWG